MTYKKVAKNVTKYYCEKCDYTSFKKCDFQKHLQTQKHNLGEILINNTQKVAQKIYVCNCGKKNINIIRAYIIIKKNVILLKKLVI